MLAVRGGCGLSKKDLETKEVFLPSRVLDACLKGWEEADDDKLALAVGEAMEHAYWHWRWLMAVRAHKCRLVVVQVRDARGDEMYPHYQIGELFTLSGWHPERALIEAQALLNESGDGLTFDLPVDEEMLGEWEELGEAFDLDAEGALEILATAMVLLDEAHDGYVEELGEDFYVASRGLERDLDALVGDEFGRWSAETMQIVDRMATVNMTQIYTHVPDGMTTPVPIVYQPEVGEDDENEKA